MDDGARVVVDYTRCIGTGNCAFFAPHTFDLNDDNQAYVIDRAGDPPESVLMAVEQCPTKALSFALGDATRVTD